MKKKILALAMAAIMLIVAVVGGTLAYFTDTDAEVNVFTVGNIDIDLREWADKVEGNEFKDIDKIMPGMTYTKIVDVENIGKNNAFVRVTIEIPENMIPVWNPLAPETPWAVAEAPAEGGAGKYVFYYTEELTPGAVTLPLLQAVKLAESVTELNAADKYEVPVFVAAIQSESFEGNYEAAMIALDNDEVVAKTETASNYNEINTLLAEGNKIVLFTKDIGTRAKITMSDKDSVLDGNGYTLEKDAIDETGSLNLGIETAGGTIKNMTIKGNANKDGNNFRAIYINNPTDDVIVENVTVIEPSLYTINTGAAGADGLTLTVKDSVLNGWTSVGGIFDYVEFKNVDFGSNGTYAMSRNYVEHVVYTDCDFVAGFSMDANATGLTIELNNCKYDGADVTAANFAGLFLTDAGAPGYYDTAYQIKACTVVVNGETVVW